MSTMAALAATAMASDEPKLPAHVHLLSSVSNPFVKHVVKLRQSSTYRHASGALVLVGDVPLREVCDIAQTKLGKEAFIEYLFLLEDTNAGDSLARFAQRVVRVTPNVMQKISGVQSAEGCNAIGITCFPSTFCSVENAVEDYPTPLSTWCHSPQRLLALDGIQDPGNLGTLLRTAAAFDWDGVFLFNGCCDPFNEKVVRASRGACFWIPIACGHWRQLRGLAEKRKMVFYAGESQGRVSRLASEQKVSSEQERGSYVTVSPGVYPLREDDSMHESLCLILGNEGRGLSKESRASCRLVSIPMPGKFESLNVAVAGGILLYLLQKRLHRT